MNLPLRAECYRLTCLRGTWIALLVPAVLGTMRVVGGRPGADENGFAVLADGLKAGAAGLTLITLFWGALSLVREREHGSLAQAFLVCSRPSLVLAKAFSMLLLLLVMAVLLLGSCAGVAFLVHDLGDLVEEGFVMAEAGDLWADLLRGFVASLPAIAAAGVFGLLVSALTESSSMALGVTMAPVLLLDLFQGLLGEKADWVFASFVPLLGERSPLSRLPDVARAYSDAGWQPGELSWAAGLPAAQAVLLLLFALFLVRPAHGKELAG
jgi:hypothetical protein